MDCAVGCILRTSNVAVLQQRLGQVKTSLGPVVSGLNIRRSPDDPDELWIVKGGTIPAEELAKKAERDAEQDSVISDIIEKIVNDT